MPADDYTPTMDEVLSAFHVTDADLPKYPVPPFAPGLITRDAATRALAAHDAELREQIEFQIHALADLQYHRQPGNTDSPGRAFARARDLAAKVARGKE